MKFFGAIFSIIFASLAFAMIAGYQIMIDYALTLDAGSDIAIELNEGNEFTLSDFSFYYWRFKQLGIDETHFLMWGRLFTALSTLTLILGIATIRSEKRLYPALVCILCPVIIYVHTGLSSLMLALTFIGALIALLAPRRSKTPPPNSSPQPTEPE